MAHSILELDKNALLWINSHHNLLLDAILAPAADVGEVGAIWFAVCVALFVVGKPGYRKAAIILLLTMIVVDRLIAARLSHWFNRERPYLALEGIRQMGIHWKGSSFPSGHAHSVWIAAIVLGSRWRRLVIPLVAFAILTCYSRPYFGMHYPVDVLVGSMLGITAGFLVVGAERLWTRRAKVRSR